MREESIPPDGRKESDDCFDMVKFGEKRRVEETFGGFVAIMWRCGF